MARRNTSLSLTPQGCRDRQDRLRRQLQARRLDAALLLHPHHVFYFANVWAGPWGAPALLIPAEGDVMIAAPDSLQADGETPAVDDWLAVRADDLATLRDRQPDLTQRALAGPIRRHRRLGVDRAPQPWIIDARVVDLTSTLLALRRAKDADELTVLRRAILGAEAAYARGRELVAPGRTELELYGELHAAAVRAVGEPIGYFGNDFQADSPGGPPRDRPLGDGELIILDLGVQVRGYRADLSRTFAVNHQPTHAQQEAWGHVRRQLEHVENVVQPGVSAKALFEHVHARLNASGLGAFGHHLGHGIGLAVHEAPRLNPLHDDVFQVGDVFTAEPGLYDPSLRAGIRLEQDYLVTDHGVERLSRFPLDL